MNGIGCWRSNTPLGRRFFSEWSADRHGANAKPSTSAASSYVAPPANSVASLQDLKDPVWIAGKAGFSVGKIVVQKAVETSAERLYIIFSIGENVQLHQACSYIGEPIKASISMPDLLEKWTVTKTEPPIQMQGTTRPKSLQFDKQKAVLFRALLDFDAKHHPKHDLAFWKRPDEVRTTGSIKEGKLVLVPIAPMLNISTKNSSSGAGISLGSHDVCAEKIEFFVLPVPKPSSDTDKFDDSALVAAFWWISQTSDKKLANMALEYVNHNGLELPMMRNTVDLAPSSKLYIWVKGRAKTEPIKVAVDRAANAPPDKKRRSS